MVDPDYFKKIKNVINQDLFNDFPTAPVVIKSLENYATEQNYSNMGFLNVASKAIEDKKIDSKEKEDLVKFANFTIKEKIDNTPINEIIPEATKILLEKEKAAYNNPNFWNRVICYIGISLLSIILLSFYLAVIERPIPDFFNTAIGALIGVLVSLFAGWTQSK